MRPCRTVVLVVAVTTLVLLAVPYPTARGGPAAVSPFAPTLPGFLRPSASPNSDWPTYMGNVERTGYNPGERSIAPTNVSELEPVWTVTTNGSDFSAPIVVNGTVYFGSWNGEEYAVNVTDGTVLWSRFLGVDTACGGYTPMGISSTPAYSNGTLYLGGGDGYWYALNATDGAVEWRFLPGAESDGYYAWASALVYRGSLYIGTASCFDSPLVPAGLLEVNLSSPHSVSHQFNSTPPGNVGESIWTTPAVDPQNNSLWVATGNEQPPGYPLYANAIVGLNATTLNVTGSWQVPSVAGQDADFGSTPTLFSSGTDAPRIVATDKNGVAFSLNRSNVSAGGGWGPLWNLSTGGGFSGGSFDGSTLYLGGGSTVYAVAPRNGSVLWSTGMDGGGTILGSLSSANGLVYAGGGSEVEAIAASNGTILWNASLLPGQQTVTEPVVAEGHVFVAAGDYGSHGTFTAYGLPTAASTVRFEESGLPPGSPWTVSMDGVARSGAVSNFSYVVGNGSHPYLLRGPAGYVVASPAPAGAVAVTGSNVTIAVSFVRGATGLLQFSESGLSRASPWCVSLGGWTGCSVRGSFALRNLTPANYAYSIDHVAGYSATVHQRGVPAPLAGTVAVGTGLSRWHVTFSLSVYPLTFHAVGLAPGRRWSVIVSGLVNGIHRTISRSTHSDWVVVLVPNGTFAYTVRPVGGYSPPSPGAASIDGSPETVNLTFVQVTYPVVVTESGLTGQNWTVTVSSTVFGWHNLTLTTNGTQLVFPGLPNGSYTFTVAPVSGYLPLPAGHFVVAGGHAPITVRFVA